MQRPTTDQRARTESYGQHGLTAVDRLGVWLSARQLRRHADFKGKVVGDFGCGYQATFVRSILDSVERAVLVDVSIAEDLRKHRKVRSFEGQLPEALRHVETSSLDVVIAANVIEHLWRPVEGLSAMHRVLKPGGTLLINVPSWRGKRFLEFSAFRLGWNPREEMDDHKRYYDVRDLWPMLVEAGFRPMNLRCFSHKFGLNTFAVCRKGQS